MLQSGETAAASAGTERAVAGVSRGRVRWGSDALSWDLTLHLLGGRNGPLPGLRARSLQSAAEHRAPN